MLTFHILCNYVSIIVDICIIDDLSTFLIIMSLLLYYLYIEIE